MKTKKPDGTYYKKITLSNDEMEKLHDRAIDRTESSNIWRRVTLAFICGNMVVAKLNPIAGAAILGVFTLPLFAFFCYKAHKREKAITLYETIRGTYQENEAKPGKYLKKPQETTVYIRTTVSEGKKTDLILDSTNLPTAEYTTWQKKGDKKATDRIKTAIGRSENPKSFVDILKADWTFFKPATPSRTDKGKEIAACSRIQY